MDNISNENNTRKTLREKFLKLVLRWKPKWFRDKQYQNQFLKFMNNNIKMTPGRLHYSNVNEYQRVMFPKLIHEYYNALQNDYQAFLEGKKWKAVEVELGCYGSSTMEVTITCLSQSLQCTECKDVQDNENYIYPRQGDLVEIIWNRERYFAYVKDKVANNMQLLLYFSTSSLDDRSLKSLNTTIISITFLEMFLAMVDVLDNLATFPLCKLILSPDAEHYRLPSQLKLNECDVPTEPKPNSMQLKVISGMIEAIEQKNSKICMVQGPPGTGKSNTIINLITSMLKRNDDVQFLLCSASNKAVDSLASMLLKIEPNVDELGLFVRIGNEEKMDESVKQISLRRVANNIRMANGTSKETDPGLENQILRKSQIICSTLTSSYTNHYMRQYFKDSKISSSKRLVCIIDEAAQCHELLTMIPLLLEIDILFLFGDHKQLEPIVLSQKARKYGFSSSLFSRAEKIFECNTSPIVMLDIQYRMVKPISLWPNKYFYNNCLKDAASVNPLGICNYLLFDHDFSQNKNGRANEKEAALIGKLIFFLSKKLNLQKNSKITIGVITPYHEQRVILQNLIHGKEDNPNTSHECNDTNKWWTDLINALWGKENLTSDDKSIDDKKINQNDETDKILPFSDRLKPILKAEEAKCVEVNTVDSFQGSERDIIIISCVRSNGLGFTGNPNRLNVSMTRAKHTLIMFGNFKAFRTNSMWSDLIEDATKRNVLVPIDDVNPESVFDKYVTVSEKVLDEKLQLL